jgi:hypothetical protein
MLTTKGECPMAIVKGTALWASVTQPNTKFDPVWSINVIPDDAEALEYFKENGFKVKPTNDGQEAVVIQRKVTSRNGKPNKPPKVINAAKEPIDVLVGNGSKVNVQYKEWSTDNQYGSFKGLDLMGVQVVDLVEYGGDADEFDNLDPDSEF